MGADLSAKGPGQTRKPALQRAGPVGADEPPKAAMAVCQVHRLVASRCSSTPTGYAVSSRPKRLSAGRPKALDRWSDAELQGPAGTHPVGADLSAKGPEQTLKSALQRAGRVGADEPPKAAMAVCQVYRFAAFGGSSAPTE